MDKTQAEKPSQPDIAAAKPELDQEAVPHSPPTDAAAIGKNEDVVLAGAPPLASTDDTVTLKRQALLLDETADAPDETGPRLKRKTDTMAIPNAGRMISAALPKQPDAIEERKSGYRHWLENKSKDDLIEMLMGLESEPPSFEATQKFLKVRVEEAQGASPETYKIPEDITYVRLPVVRRSAANEPTPTWQIALVSLEGNSRPMGLLIDSEITVGRAAGEAAPDLDLTPYGAKTKGVSRIHARIRPTMNNLWLIDNDSSNGTFWNRLRIPNEVEQPLKEGDVIAFGRINFLVKIVRSPNTRETKTLF